MAIASNSAMGSAFFHEFKKQASFFLKEKIRTARLALTDVTPAQLLTEEATNANPWGPDAKTMGFISRAAFDIDDYYRIVEILHKRFSKYGRHQWREPYKALILLEHLLTHGPESIAQEFRSDREVIQEMGTLQFIDEKGFDWGSTVRKKSERVLMLLEKGPLLKEERNRARKISLGIQGFGSFSLNWSSNNRDRIDLDSDCYARSNSNCEDYSGQGEAILYDQKENLNSNVQTNKSLAIQEDRSIFPSNGVSIEASKALLPHEEGKKIELHKVDHPFKKFEHHNRETLLLLSQS
ncbi:epsin-3 [Typha latifolia]|uniref:epsin-3 n=1 Tax=Typha latifolia TaxID=4733 RepID=UPI003C2AC5C6